MARSLTKVFENPDVYCVVVPDASYRTGATNCFLIEDQGEVLLVDVGAESAEGERVLKRALGDLGASGLSARLFLTHLHADHAELADRAFGEGASVLLGRPEADLSAFVHDETRLRAFLARLSEEGFSLSDVEDCVDLKLGVAAFDPARFEVRYVEEGDSVSVGRHRFRVLDSSGHAPGHRSLFCPEAGLLIGGDQVLSRMAPYISFYPGVGDRLGLFLDRLEALSCLDVRCALCSHGPAVIEGFKERARWTMDHRAQRTVQLEELVARNPGCCGAQLAKSVQSSRSSSGWEEADRVVRLCVASNGLALLDRLLALGRIRFEVDGLGVRRYWLAGRD